MDSTVLTFDATDWIEAIRKWYHGEDYAPLFTKPIQVKLSALRIILMIMVVCLIQQIGRFNRDVGRLPSPTELFNDFGVTNWMSLFPVIQQLGTSVTRGNELAPQSSLEAMSPLLYAMGAYERTTGRSGAEYA